MDYQSRIKLLSYCLNKDYVIIYPPQGLGDILILCLFLKSYKEKHKKKVVVLVTKNHFKQLCGMFNEIIDDIIFVKKRPKLIKIIKKRFINLENIYKKPVQFVSIEHNIAKELDILENNEYFSNYKSVEMDFENIQKGKTVVIAPYAVTCPNDIPKKFWCDLAEMFIKKGFDVVFNVPLGDSSFNYKKCFYDIKTTIALVNYCGYFVGYRSGLCDVIGYFSEAKKFYIYPTNPLKGDNFIVPDNISYVQHYKNICSIKNMYNKDCYEYIYDNNVLNIIENEIKSEK